MSNNWVCPDREIDRIKSHLKDLSVYKTSLLSAILVWCSVCIYEKIISIVPFLAPLVVSTIAQVIWRLKQEKITCYEAEMQRYNPYPICRIGINWPKIWVVEVASDTMKNLFSDFNIIVWKKMDSKLFNIIMENYSINKESFIFKYKWRVYYFNFWTKKITWSILIYWADITDYENLKWLPENNPYPDNLLS